MKTARKLASLTLFIGAFVSINVATAQPAAEQPEPTQVEGRPDHGYAPPSDEAPPPHQENTADTKTGVDEHTGVGTGESVHAKGEGDHGAAHGGGHGDPTKHFNYVSGGGGLFGYIGKDAYGGPMGDGQMVDTHTGEVIRGEEKMSPPFIFMVLNFVILFGLLAWKAGPVARKAAVERHDQIKTALDEAAKLRDEAQKKLAEYESRLKDADAEIKAMVEGIRKDADADKARILENAEKAAAQMKKDAETRIAAEIELARATLTREVTDVAAKAAETIIREKLMPADQTKLVASFITDMGTAKESSNASR